MRSATLDAMVQNDRFHTGFVSKTEITTYFVLGPWRGLRARLAAPISTFALKSQREVRGGGGLPAHEPRLHRRRRRAASQIQQRFAAGTAEKGPREVDPSRGSSLRNYGSSNRDFSNLQMVKIE